MSEPRSPLKADPERTPFIWAHRGASVRAPENTIEAFQLAQPLGADGIELDVRLTSDGVPVIYHDRALWSDGSKLYCRPDPRLVGAVEPMLIAECSWAELAGIDVVHWGERSAPLTRLEEVLEVVPETLWVDVEVKAGRDYDERIASIVDHCIRRRPARVLASSFDHVVLRELAQLDDALPLLAICHARLVDPLEVLAQIPTAMVCVDRPFLELDDVTHWRSTGVEVSVGALDERYDLSEVLDWPLASIFVDDPEHASRLALAASATR